MEASPESYRDDEWAVFDSWTSDQLSEPMTRADCVNWIRDTYADSDTRPLHIRYVGRTITRH